MSRVLAIGDIHTKNWIIEQVSKITDSYDRIVFCGDYADDFNANAQDSLTTWKLLKDLQTKHQTKVSLVLGNHDYIYVYDTPSLQSGYNPITHALINAPENKKLKNWLINLPIIIEIDGVTYSHGGITNEWSGDQDINGLWNYASPIWPRLSNGTEYKDTPQVFGHTPVNTCLEVQDQVWSIDTFSTMPNNSPFGDGSMLEILNGKKFSKIYLK